MSLIITDSPDITLLRAEAIFDLSGVTPSVTVNNLSQGPNLADVDYAFKVQSPTLTYIHDGVLSSPDESGIWTTSVIADPWPRPFNNIEFGLYRFQILAKDSEGNEYAAPVQSVKICRPNGNLPTSQNAYGLGEVTIQTRCEQARVYFQDMTNTSYQGLSGTQGSSVLRVSFPMDTTGTVPTPFEINYFTTAMVPITYSGKGYQFLYTSVWQYDFGDDVYVRIKYVLKDVFGVWCGIDLMPLICEFEKLAQSIESGSCADSSAAERKMMLINPKFALLMMGIMQPLLGIDVPALIAQIEEIGDFDCDCCNVASGVLPAGSNAFDGYTFTVVPQGGDVDGEFQVNGFNIQLLVHDVSYIFKMCDESPAPTTAFTITPTISGDGYTKTYCLNVDVAQLAEDILNTIKTNQTLVNLFNSIVNTSNGDWNLIVDGKCIFNSSATYDYEFHLEDIPEDTTFAQIVSMNIDGTNDLLGYSFNMTGLPALQTYLNTLGYGTFVVSASSPTTVDIISTNNPTNINQLLYNNGTLLEASFDKTGSGFTPLTANEVVQAIIDYICALDDAQVVTSQAYEICYIDEEGEKQIQTIAAGTDLTDFLLALTEKGCTTIDYIVSIGSLNCASIKEKFPASLNVMQADDYFLGTKQGDCARILPVEAFLMMLEYAQYNTEAMTAFCNMVNQCGAGNICAPYDVFYAVVEPGSPGDADLVITFEHPAAVSHTIRYARIDNTVSPVYTTISGVLPGESPYTIEDVANGQYRVGIKAVYSDGRLCQEQFYDTLPCTGVSAFNAIYNGTNIVVTGTLDDGLSAKVTIDYPNGGQYSEIFETSEGSLSETIAPPAEVYGTFYAKVAPVCDTDSGFIGADTAPVTFEIEETSP